MNAQKLDVQGASSFFKDRSVSLTTKVLGLLAVLYVLSPIDLIPDVIPFFGWLDDVGFLTLAFGLIGRDMAKHAREAKQAPPSAQVLDVAPERAGE